MPYQFISVDPHAKTVIFITETAALVVSYSEAVGRPALADALPDTVITLLCRSLADQKLKISRS